MTPVVTESLSRPIFIKEIGKNIKELPIKKGTRLDGVTGILLNLHRPVNPYATGCIPEPWKRKKSSSRSFLWSEYNIDLYTKLQTPQFFTSLYSHVFCYGILLCSPLWLSSALRVWTRGFSQAWCKPGLGKPLCSWDCSRSALCLFHESLVPKLAWPNPSWISQGVTDGPVMWVQMRPEEMPASAMYITSLQIHELNKYDFKAWRLQWFITQQ